MQTLDGKKIRDAIALRLKGLISEKIEQGFTRPCSVIIQVGNNQESALYIKNKKTFGEKIGAVVTHVHLPQSITQEEILKEIKNLNTDASVHGIIIQMPLPAHLHREVCIEAIDPHKDIDGLHSYNVKTMWVHGEKGIVPATTRGILTLLSEYNVEISGKHVVVVGRSFLVGRPTAIAFLNKNATVTLCHSKTENLEFHTSAADIIIAAAGIPRLISTQHVRPGQVIVDVGITIEEVPERKAVGDVDFDAVKGIVSGVSPVPGGAGPMTVASLFENLYDVYSAGCMIQ
jgi:methylenetetrahydrofolate dehydrogenase (NADP+) / methenyltetrahydrofolate cyclohydrolase